MIAIPAACAGSKPMANATMYAPKIPNWAAAPTNTNAKEYQWRIPTCLYTLIQNIQYRALLVDTNLKTGICFERNITNEDTKTNGYQQQRLEVLLDSKEQEEQTYQNHDEVLAGCLRKASVLPEIGEVITHEW